MSHCVVSGSMHRGWEAEGNEQPEHVDAVLAVLRWVRAS